MSQPRLPLVFDAEGVDLDLSLPPWPRFDATRRTCRRRHRLPRLAAEGDDVLDLEVDHVPDADAVAEARRHGLDRRRSTPASPSSGRALPSGRPSPAEAGGQLLHPLVARPLVDEHPPRQSPSVMTFGVSTITAIFVRHVRPLDLTLANVKTRVARNNGTSPNSRTTGSRAHEIAEHGSK